MDATSIPPPQAAAAAAPGAAAAAVPAVAVAPAPALTPWGVYGTANRSKKASKAALKLQRQQAAAGPPKEEKLPRALLQQYCQGQGWLPPKFEKIAAVGAVGQGFRYRVTVAPAAGGAGGKGKAGVRKGVLTAPRSFQLFADEAS